MNKEQPTTKKEGPPEISDFITIIRPQLMTFCKDACRAATLNHILFRIAWKCKDQPKAKIQDGEVLWYAKNEQITSEMSNAWGVCKVRQEVNALLDMNLIGKRKNPNWGGDRTKHFCFGSEQCAVFLNLCEANNICVVHLDFPVEVKHLIYSSVANDTSIKCCCSQGVANDKSIDCKSYSHRMEMIHPSDGNDTSIGAIPKNTTKTTAEEHNEEEGTYTSPANHDDAHFGSAFAAPTHAPDLPEWVNAAQTEDSTNDSLDDCTADGLHVDHGATLRGAPDVHHPHETPSGSEEQGDTSAHGTLPPQAVAAASTRPSVYVPEQAPHSAPPEHFAAQVQGFSQFYHDFCIHAQDRGINDGLTLLVKNLNDVPQDAECQICYTPVHGPHGYAAPSHAQSQDDPTCAGITNYPGKIWPDGSMTPEHAHEDMPEQADGDAPQEDHAQSPTSQADSPQASAKAETKGKRTRTPKPPSVSPEDMDLYRRVFDECYREALDDESVGYAHTKASNACIRELLELNLARAWFVTPKKLHAVYVRLWNMPKDARTGFYWREHMSIRAICKNYEAHAMALTTAAHEKQQASQPLTAEEFRRQARARAESGELLGGLYRYIAPSDNPPLEYMTAEQHRAVFGGK